MVQPASKRVVTEASAVLAAKSPIGHTHSGGGLSAYEVAVNNGFIGTEAQWLASLVGNAPPASTTTAGIARFPTAAELATGTATNLHPSVANLVARIATHAAALDAHPALAEAISDVQQALAGKADNPVLPENISGSSVVATPNSVVVRDIAAHIEAAPGVLDGHVATVKQARDFATAYVAGSDVRDLKATGIPLTLSTSASTWTDLGGIVVPDAATGHEWECELAIKYQAEPGSGFKIRHKGGATAVTNLLAGINPSFETTDLSAWVPSSNATFTRGTAAAGFDGAAYGVLTATAAGNLILTSAFVPIGMAAKFAAGIRARLGVGTARSTRIDINYATDAAGTGTGGWDLGTTDAVTPTAGAWARATVGNVDGATPNIVGATHAKVRVVYVNTSIGDAVHLDAAQLEPGFPLPAFGSTGGSGASALEVTGEYRGLALLNSAGGNPTLDDYKRRVGIRTPAVAFTAAEFGGLGTTVDAELTASLRFTVVGTNLTGQRLEFQVAPRAAATVAPKIVAARAVFARVL